MYVHIIINMLINLSVQVSVTPPPGFGGAAKTTSPPTSQEDDSMRVQSFYQDSMGVSYDPKMPSKTRVTGLVSTGQSSSGVGREKQKFVPLMSAEGQSRATMQFPGRHACHCLAQKHGLINNCTECGRIVCAQVRSCRSVVFSLDVRGISLIF